MGRDPTRTPAFVLRSIAYGEADRILTLFTLSDGRVSVLARGARKSSKRFGGALEPFCRVEVAYTPGRGDLFRLQEARVERPFPGLLTSLSAMSRAGAGLELVRAVTPERAPEPPLFVAIERFLAALAAPGPTDSARLPAFQLEVLTLAGLAPGVDSCARCGREAPAGKAALFEPTLGGVVCRACGGGPFKLTGSMRRAIREAGHGGGLATLSSRELAALERVLDAFLTRQLARPLAGERMVRAAEEVERRGRRTEPS